MLRQLPLAQRNDLRHFAGKPASDDLAVCTRWDIDHVLLGICVLLPMCFWCSFGLDDGEFVVFLALNIRKERHEAFSR